LLFIYKSDSSNGYFSRIFANYCHESAIAIISPELARALIETVNDQLQNISQVVHSRHRSISNFMVNIIAGLIACTWQDKKPS